MNVCDAAGRSLQTVPAGPFTPDQAQSTYFVMRADDCLLHFRAEDLTPRQRADDEANVVLTAMLQVALTYMGRAKDHAAYHELFKQSPWREMLSAYNGIFEELFGDVIPSANYHYFPTEKFYETVAAVPVPTELVNLYMISGSNLALHRNQAAWQMSQRANSKMHFARHAPAAGIPVPRTLITTKGALGDNETNGLFADCGDQVMVKIQGLAGARNVTAVDSIDAAREYLAEFPDDIEVALQQRLDTAAWTEMTCDLKITDDSIDIINVRQILFADGLWVGNYISDKLILSERQRQVCRQVGEYARSQGYTSPQGYNCGIDFFVRGDDIIVIEINARWTGGLFPAHLIERLGAQAEDAIAFIDVIHTSHGEDYLTFLRDNLYADLTHPGSFRTVPMGFSPFVQDMDGAERIYVWQVVLGDFEAFKQAKNHALGADELPTADAISLSL